MNLLLRLLGVWLGAPFGPRCEPLGPSLTAMRVWPRDLDPLMHVNNGVYLSMLDLGRIDLMLRSGLMRILRASGWYFVVAAETIHFRRSLKLFQRFEIETRVLGWDDRAFVIQQLFRRRGETVATALVQGRLLRRGGGPVAPRELLEAAALESVSPALPDWIQRWVEDQRHLRQL